MSSRTSTWLRIEIALGGIAVAAALSGCANFASGPAVEGGELASPPLRRAFLTDARAEAYQHFVVAQLKARAGQFPDAVAELREAIKYDPASAALWIQLSQWLARTNDVPQAQEAAQKAITLEPNNSEAHQALAELLKRQKRFPKQCRSWKRPLRSRRSRRRPI